MSDTQFSVAAIADGTTRDGKLRVSLSVAPTQSTSAEVLGDWPVSALRYARALQAEMSWEEEEKKEPVVEWTLSNPPREESAKALWKKVFHDDKHLESLKGYLESALDQNTARNVTDDLRRVTVWSPLLAHFAEGMFTAMSKTKESPPSLLKTWLARHQLTPGFGGAPSLPAVYAAAQPKAALEAKGVAELLDQQIGFKVANGDVFPEMENQAMYKAAAEDLLVALGFENGQLPAENAENDVLQAPSETGQERAGRMLTALAAHPSIAEAVGLLIDATLEPPTWPTAGGKLFLVVAGKRFAVHWDGRNIFMPRTRNNDLLTPAGIVNLAAKVTNQEDAKRRFYLNIVDGTNAFLAQQQRAAAIVDAVASGSSASGVDLSEPDITESGITLYDLERPKSFEEDGKGETKSEYYAEDLLRGFRIDCHLDPMAQPTTPEKGERWRPLMARSIAYATSGATWPESPFSYRDEGFSQPGVVSNGNVEHVPLEVLSWKGESLGAPPPAPEDDNNGEQYGPDLQDSDLPIKRTIGPPKESAYKPPPLRFGRTYRIGARACYINGVGPTIDQSRALYDKHNTLQITYERVSRIRAPVVLLPKDSALYRLESPPPGETSVRLVAKRDPGTSAAEYRIVVPGSVAFETAEQYGQFDDKDSLAQCRPSGAFNGEHSRTRLNFDLTGGFPVAQGSRRQAFSSEAGEGSAGRPSRGLVADFDTAAHENARYYPDSRAQVLHWRWRCEHETDWMTREDEAIKFWTGSHPRDSKPAIIRMVASKLRPKEKLVSIHTMTSTEGTDGIRLPSVEFRLQPAVRTFVELYCSEGSDGAKDSTRVTLGMFKTGTTFNAAAQSVTRIELVHPVMKPLVPPRISELCVTIASGAETAKKGDQQDGTTAFFTGKCDIHGRSTGGLRLDGGWDEHGPEFLSQDTDGRWRYQPQRRQDLLFSDGKVSQKADEFGISADTARYSFPDGRARKLDIDVVASTAFREFYADNVDAASFEVRATKPYEIVVPCSFRPPEPDHLRALPVPRWRTYRNAGGTRFRVELKWSVRVYFGPMFMASGYGERIALLLKDGEARPTQWGDDPIDGTGGLTKLVPCLEDFENGDPLYDKARGLSGKLFTPVVDRIDGPVLDLDIATIRTFRPFLQLGLFRYQPHSIEDELKLSPCKPRSVVLLPWRRVEVKVTGRSVAITVQGPTYTARNMAKNDVWGSSRLRVRLLRRTDQQTQGTDWTSPPLVPVMENTDGPTSRLLEREVAAVPGLSAYSLLLDLPRSLNQERYVLLLEEREFLRGDEKVTTAEWPPDTEVARDDQGPIVSRIIFQRRIDLGREAGLMEDPHFDKTLRNDKW